VAGTKRLIEQEHVPVLIGRFPRLSPMPSCPVVAEAKVPLVIATSAGQTSSMHPRRGNDYAFKTIPSETRYRARSDALLGFEGVKSVAHRRCRR